MIAKFENSLSSATGYTSICKYKNLHNLLHWHAEHEIIYVIEGDATLNINNNFHTLSNGMCAFIKSESVHSINGSDESIIQVMKTSCPPLNVATTRKNLRHPVIKNAKKVISAFDDITREIKNQSEYTGIISDAVATRLIAEIFRDEDIQSVVQPESTEKNICLLSRITNEFSHISFEDAANYMNFSKSYFSKYFHNLTGMKFTQYINILKVSAAIDKIKERKYTVTEISSMCGFETIRNFNRIFKKLTGYSPKSLPEDYIFRYTIINGDNTGFNPTLNTSEIIE